MKNEVRGLLKIIPICLIYSLIIVLINLVVIFIFTQNIIQMLYLASFIVLIEGGLALIAGAGIALYSPIFNKIFGKITYSESLEINRNKGSEPQAEKWVIVGGLLVIEALIISAF